MLVVWLTVMILSACTFAPGMHFDDSDAKVEPESAGSKVTPVIKAITPELIDQELLQTEKESQPDLPELMTSAQPYKIGPGDQLAITVWDHPELVMPVTSMSGTVGSLAGTLPPGYTVSSEGTIQFPYSGDLKVEGLTEAQARDLLVQQLSGYIKQPQITLRVLNYRSKRVYVDGEVRSPGIVQVDDIPLSLPEALNRAGGITPLGDQSRISITRAGKTYWVDLSRLTESGINPSLIMIKSGDLLRVHSSEETKVYVIGEVVRPVSLTLRNGHLSLNEALGEAGGINPETGDGKLIYVIRNANDNQPIVYHLDARSPVMLALADKFDLKPKDVVYVDSAAIVRYNRIISLILPTTQEITWINRGFK